MTYQLTYFSSRGRAEQIRLLLAELGQQWEDVTVNREGLGALKAQGAKVLPFGALPVLDDGDFRLAQGPVIMGYLARKHGIAPSDLKNGARADAVTLAAEDLRMAYFKLFGADKETAQKEFIEGRWTNHWLNYLDGLLASEGTGFFVGNKLTHADVAIWDVLNAVLANIQGASIEGRQQLEHFYAAIAERANIGAYLERRKG